MTLAPFDPAPAARVLLDAWRSGTRLANLPESMRPADLAQGYDAQDALFAAAGGRRGGWKLGVGSPAQLRANDLARPLVGQLDAARIHPSGAALTLPTPDALTLECEIGIVLARDLPPQADRALTADDVRHACVTFELVRSRFADRRAVGWPSFVADNVGFEALVVGDAFCQGLDVDALRRVNDSATVLVDGEPRARALSGDMATDPLASLAALFAHAAARGITLKAGEIVSTGAMCQPFDMPAQGHAVRVTYAGGEVSFRL